MATKIIHKKSSVASSVPVAGDLAPGEIAINLADKKLYSKTTGGTIIELGGSAYTVGDGGLTEINFTTADNTKLDGIEAGATADQTAAEILTAIKTVDGTGSGLDADLLDGQHASAFATAAQGTTADNALPRSGGTMTGSVTLATDTKILSGSNIYTELGANVNNTFEIKNTTASTNSAANLLTLSHYSTGVPSAGFGSAVEFRGENPVSGTSVYGSVAGVWEGGNTNPSGGALVFSTDGYNGGNTERMRISSEGNITVTGTVDGRDVSADGTKLDGIAASANNYTHPTGAGNNHIPTGGTVGQVLKNTASGTATWQADNNTVYTHPTTAGNKHIPTGGTVGQILKNTASGTATWQADNNTTYSVGDGGLTEINFTTDDNTKLDGIEAGANNYTHPANHAISVITGLQTALDGKVDDSQVLTNVPSGAVFTDTDTVYTHPTTAGNKHIPTGGTVGQVLKNTASGTATWQNDNNTTYSVGDGGLTEVNFTTADNTKLDGIAASANNYTHPTTAGNKHIPTAGAAGQFLKYSASGTAVWAADNDTVYTHPTGAGNNHIPTGGTVGQILKNTASGTATWQADNNTTYTVGDGGLTEKNFTSADNTKLDGIEAGATADQTAAQLLAAIKTVDGAGSGLDADLLDGNTWQSMVPYHSGSDFPNGTLVTTSIPASAASGASFIIEVTGKSYSTAVPHSVIAQGYLYNSTIINFSGTNIAGSVFTYMKAMNNGGYLSFWWPSHGYWNSYSVTVRDAGGSTINTVTAIANAVDPTAATKKVQINLAKSWNSDNDGAGSGLDADLLDGQSSAYYTGYADTAVANLVASAPGTLDTLNELAAALGDDASFSTTVTNSIAAKLPLAGGAMTGSTTISGDNHITFGPNSSWASSLRIGGNGRTATGTEMASIVTTDGNIHLDAANSANGIYLNYYAGTNGTLFGNGAGATVATMSSAGNLTINGTVDGRDVAADGTKLDTIATSANNYSFPYTISTADSNNTVVLRTADGYIFGDFFNGFGTFSTTGNTSGMGRFTGTNGTDTYGRSYTAAAARTLLNVADGANNTVTNATHTGEVTGSGALTIASNVVDADNLKVTGNGTVTQYLRSDGDGTFTWATPPDTNTVYSHPTHPGDDFSLDTTALTGATVISDIAINVTTDTYGHVTDANGTVATRTLTLADLGYTGATNANNSTSNATHTGEVTGSGVLTIADNVVDAGNLYVTGNGTTAQYLRSDGDGSFTWATPPDTNTVYTLPLATDTVRGGIELFSTTDQTVAPNTVTATAGRTYGLQLNAADQAMVNVPWTDTDTIYTHPNHTGEVTGSGALTVADDVIDAGNLKVTGNGTTSQYLRSDGDGTFTWATPTDTNTTYNFSGTSLVSRNSSNALAIDSADSNNIGYCNTSTAAGYADGGMFVAAYSTSWVSQIFSNFRTGALSSRGKDNGTWGAWRTQWDSGNDGVGSGLDADLLDGQHGSYYYAASNPSGYTTNVGDITGVTAGSGISGGGTSGTVTVSHAATSTQASLTALTGAAVVSDIDLDTYGHVTSLATRNLTLANLGYTGATNANNTVTNATHTGEVTGSGALTIADNVVDAGNLKVTGNGTTSQYLRSDGDGTFTWDTPSAGSGKSIVMAMVFG